MIDTVKLVSPYLSESTIAQVEEACVRRMELEIATGDVRWELTTGSLAGSYDHRVSVRIEREEWHNSRTLRQITEEVVTGKRDRATTIRVASPPYITIEGSVHKALMGHNVHGGPLPPVLALCWFVDEVGKRLGVSLPPGEDWYVQRIDWAECYQLPDFAACEEYMSGLNMARFPRRSAHRYGSEAISFPGTTTAVKLYHKGPEFYKHDRVRLKDHLSPDEMQGLQDRANCILRFETEIKAKKLTADFEGKPLVVQLTQEYLESVHDREAARLLKEAEHEMETVRTHREVSRRLAEVYDQRLANTLFGTWMQLAALGEDEVRRTMARATWFRQKKQLAEAGISWHAADVRIVPTRTTIPRGFTPLRSDPRRLVRESDKVALTLGTYQR